MRWNLIAMAIIGVSSAMADGVLQLGNSQSENSRVTMPISIRGDVADGVASLNFELTYDPQTVRVVALEPGQAARQTGKQVQWHETEPGHLNVVVMGFNQQTLTGGEVVQLTVEPTGSSINEARIRVDNSNFASNAGDLIPSRGSTASAEWNTKSEETPDPQESPGAPVPAPAPVTPGTQTPGSIGGGTAPHRTEAAAGPPSSTATSGAEQRLNVARNQAESIRPLLGTSRESAAMEQAAGSDTANASGNSRVGNNLLALRAGVNSNSDSSYPVENAATEGTPNKKLENAETAGHNTRIANVLMNSGRRGWFVIILVTALAGLVIICVVRMGR